ncbi:MAG: ion channel [Eubacteriaceae bacterium]
MDKMIPSISTYENLANGDTIILIYDIFVLLLFVFNLFLYKNKTLMDENSSGKSKTKRNMEKFFPKIVKSYDRHGMLTVTSILFFITIISIATHHQISTIEFLSITIAFMVFFVILYLLKRFFMGIDQFTNEIVSRSVDLIFYLILGHSIVIFSAFIETPHLPLGLIGLGFALFLCFIIMFKAITNPGVIMHKTSKKAVYNQTSTGVLKGMLAIIVSEFAILYLMIYNCFQVNTNFYMGNSGRALDAFDMLYYLMTSFATIGYGDIHPVRFNGEIYSELIAIVIAIASMYSTACFVGAVISGAATLEKQRKNDV